MLGCPPPGSCAPIARLTGVPRSRFCTAHPHFSISSHTLLSRASLARLHTAGFPEILDHNEEPVEISEPADPATFSLRLEEADPLQGNEIILQFLAFGRWGGSSFVVPSAGTSQGPPLSGTVLSRNPPTCFPA